MCHVSHAPRLHCVGNGTDAAKKLQNDPESNGYERGHLNDSLALQYSDFSLWEQQNVSASTPAIAPEAPKFGTLDPWLNANWAKVAASPQSR